MVVKSVWTAILLVAGLLASSRACWAEDAPPYVHDAPVAGRRVHEGGEEIFTTPGSNPFKALAVIGKRSIYVTDGVDAQGEADFEPEANIGRNVAETVAGEAPFIHSSQARLVSERSPGLNELRLDAASAPAKIGSARGAVGPGARAKAASPIAVDLHAGTTGVGAQIEYVANAYFAGRLSGDWLDIGHNFQASNITYSGRAKWMTVGVFGDFHPFKNGWLVSAGAYHGMRKASATSAQVDDVVFNGMHVPAAEIGSVRGKAKLARTSPFVGLGWDGAQHAHRGVTFRALAGADFGDPKVTLSDSGPAAGAAQLQHWLAKEQAEAQSKVGMLKAYPVVQLGVAYRF